MADTTIRAIPNGPYRVHGPAKIIDPVGNEIAIEEDRAVSTAASAFRRPRRR